MGRSVLAGLILEPISKSLAEDDKASELHEAEEVLRIELPADEDEGCRLDRSRAIISMSS
jgi:hypothetical protein